MCKRFSQSSQFVLHYKLAVIILKRRLTLLLQFGWSLDWHRQVVASLQASYSFVTIMSLIRTKGISLQVQVVLYLLQVIQT